jgi:hypothetical protein
MRILSVTDFHITEVEHYFWSTLFQCTSKSRIIQCDWILSPLHDCYWIPYFFSLSLPLFYIASHCFVNNSRASPPINGTQNSKNKKRIQGYNNKNTEEFVYALVEVSIKTKHLLHCPAFLHTARTGHQQLAVRTGVRSVTEYRNNCFSFVLCLFHYQRQTCCEN